MFSSQLLILVTGYLSKFNTPLSIIKKKNRFCCNSEDHFCLLRCAYLVASGFKSHAAQAEFRQKQQSIIQ